MKRLFISLYLVVVFALALIGWSTDSLWRLLQSSSDSEITQLAKLTKLVRLGQGLHLIDTRKLLSEQLQIPITTIEFADVAWLDEQVAELTAGEPVLMYDGDDRLLIYLLLKAPKALSNTRPQVLTRNSQLVQFGPIDIATGDNQVARALYFMSYLLLAVVIGLWSRPLWRDLSVLQKATEAFGQGQWQQAPKVSASSVIAPVVDTFKEMSARIGRLVTEQKELTNAVSHELRTPLARLKFSLALLDSPDADGMYKNTIAGMSADVSELEALVDEMLSYSRLESEGRQLLLAVVDISELLSHLVEKLSVNCEHEITLDIPTGLKWVCDGHFVERAMQNLITNAIRYGDSKVWVGAKVEDNGKAQLLHLTVIDDGQGIDKAKAKDVFKPFVRLDKSRTKDTGGFGLGLAIVKRIVDWHQGQVQLCQSKQQAFGGAEFTLIFPRLRVTGELT